MRWMKYRIVINGRTGNQNINSSVDASHKSEYSPQSLGSNNYYPRRIHYLNYAYADLNDSLGVNFSTSRNSEIDI
jgi:hypothetical protein